MARIRSLTPGNQKIRKAPSEVDCYYQVLADKSGETILHLTTFGSDDRKSAKKSSQSLQLDAELAENLAQLLRETFDLRK